MGFADQADLKGREAEMVGAQRTFDPVVTVLEGKKRWVLEGSEKVQSPEALKQFFEDVTRKKLKPRYKSAVPPESLVDDDGVTVLTGNTFEEHALNAKQDVFVFFYGPDCEHSREMKPEWVKLAQRVSESGWQKRGVVIAKMDGTENACEEEVTAFPKLVLYPAVSATKKFKQRQIYRGKQRTMEKMVDFLLENSRNLEGLSESDIAGV